MLITNPTAHSQSLPRAPTPAPTRGPEQVTRAAPVPPVLPVLLAVVTGRGTEAGTWRLEPLNLARSPAPAAEALLGLGVPQDAHSRTQTPVDPLQQRAVPDVTAPIEEADEWQMRLLFNLDPLGSFGAWLRWNEQDGLSVDCWIESRRCFHIASKLEDQLHETLDRIGIKRLALHSGAMPQPSIAVPGGSNVNVTV